MDIALTKTQVILKSSRFILPDLEKVGKMHEITTKNVSQQKQNSSINLEQKPIVNRQLPNVELNYKEQIQYFKICALF